MFYIVVLVVTCHLFLQFRIFDVSLVYGYDDVYEYVYGYGYGDGYAYVIVTRVLVRC